MTLEDLALAHVILMGADHPAKRYLLVNYSFLSLRC